MSELTPTTDSIVSTDWPTAPNGDGSNETDWDDASIGAFSEIFVTRLQVIAEDESLDETTGPQAIDALVSEASEATNIPVPVIINYIDQITNPDPLPLLAAMLDLSLDEIVTIGG